MYILGPLPLGILRIQKTCLPPQLVPKLIIIFLLHMAKLKSGSIIVLAEQKTSTVDRSLFCDSLPLMKPPRFVSVGSLQHLQCSFSSAFKTPPDCMVLQYRQTHDVCDLHLGCLQNYIDSHSRSHTQCVLKALWETCSGYRFPTHFWCEPALLFQVGKKLIYYYSENGLCNILVFLQFI